MTDTASMTIGRKISLACTLLAGFTIVLGIASTLELNRVNSDVASITKESLPGVIHLYSLIAAAKEEKFSMMAHIATNSPDEKKKMESAIADLEVKVRAEAKGYLDTNSGARGRELLAELLQAHDRMNLGWAKILPVSRSLNSQGAYALWMSESQGPLDARNKAASELIADTLLNASEIEASAVNSGKSARIQSILIVGFSVIAGSLLAFFIVRGINRVLSEAVTELSEGARQITSASGQVSDSSQSLAQGASEQAASLEETSASSAQMASTTRKNSDNSEQAATLMDAVSKSVVEANRTLDDMTASMQEIGASSGKISKIVKVIDEIAFQTNILALNASVEAARAGEAGMGFAVVAGEVRNLAQRSAQAAKDTEVLIEDSILKSTGGSKKLVDVVASIHGITEGAGKVKVLVDEVEASSKEQAQGIEQISKAVAQMDEVTQRSAATAEESASASEQLNAQSHALMAVVERLEALVGSN